MFKRIILPFFASKEIKPVSFLLSPKDLVLCMTLSILLAQLADGLKGLYSLVDIQRINSVKVYSKLISTGFSSRSLSSIYAISKTLGPDLESLSLLSSNERIHFIRSLHSNLIYNQLSWHLSDFSSVYTDPLQLFSYRKGLALQCRSVFAATPVFLPYSLVLGAPVSNVDLKLIIDSARFLWCYSGLDELEFDFILHKEALKFYVNEKNSFIRTRYAIPVTLYDSAKILVFSEFFNTFSLTTNVIFNKDFFILKSPDNLTWLERDLGFFTRSCPRALNEIYISDIDMSDDMIKSAVEQRKLYRLRARSSSLGDK